jgi:hypothetical protein
MTNNKYEIRNPILHINRPNDSDQVGNTADKSLSLKRNERGRVVAEILQKFVTSKDAS